MIKVCNLLKASIVGERNDVLSLFLYLSHFITRINTNMVDEPRKIRFFFVLWTGFRIHNFLKFPQFSFVKFLYSLTIN